MRNLRYPHSDGDGDDGRLDAPAFHRNIAPIAEALTPRLAHTSGELFEVGSGSGQHAVALAQALPALTLWPSDPDPRHCASIDAWARRLNVANIRRAMIFDATSPDWGDVAGGPEAVIRAILSINVIHIARWAVTEGLFRGAAARLAPRGVLALYGPFRFCGAHVSGSNEAFDESLRLQNPDWGVRDVEAIDALAGSCRFTRAETVKMPSNNQMLFFRRAAEDP